MVETFAAASTAAANVTNGNADNDSNTPCGNRRRSSGRTVRMSSKAREAASAEMAGRTSDSTTVSTARSSTVDPPSHSNCGASPTTDTATATAATNHPTVSVGNNANIACITAASCHAEAPITSNGVTTSDTSKSDVDVAVSALLGLLGPAAEAGDGAGMGIINMGSTTCAASIAAPSASASAAPLTGTTASTSTSTGSDDGKKKQKRRYVKRSAAYWSDRSGPNSAWAKSKAGRERLQQQQAERQPSAEQDQATPTPPRTTGISASPTNGNYIYNASQGTWSENNNSSQDQEKQKGTSCTPPPAGFRLSLDGSGSSSEKKKRKYGAFPMFGYLCVLHELDSIHQPTHQHLRMLSIATPYRSENHSSI